MITDENVAAAATRSQFPDIFIFSFVFSFHKTLSMAVRRLRDLFVRPVRCAKVSVV